MNVFLLRVLPTGHAWILLMDTYVCVQRVFLVMNVNQVTTYYPINLNINLISVK